MPHHWTGGLRRSKNPIDTDPMLAGNSIRLGAPGDDFTKTTADGINYGSGFTLAGKSLNSQAGYSGITKMYWNPNRTGCTKWLYGKNTDPVQASEVQAKSNC